MLSRLKNRLAARVTSLLAAPVAEALATAFSDPASLDGLPTETFPSLTAPPEADWTDVYDEDAEPDLDPYWAMGLSVVQPAETFQEDARTWDVHDLFLAGYTLGVWSKPPSEGGDCLVPILDEISWEAAQALISRGVGMYWASPEEGDGPGFFVYP